MPDGLPFTDLIEVGRTPREERELAEHPSLKPQALLRELVYSVLPRGKGIVLDPFMGSGSTVAASVAIGVQCIGVEKNNQYFEIAKKSIEHLSRIVVRHDQLSLPLVQ